MTLPRIITAIFLSFALLLPSLAEAKSAKKYQVTGIILALTDEVITVEKGDEKWEIDRSANTKVTGTLKVGAKVTIEYTMSAATAEVKDTPATKAK